MKGQLQIQGQFILKRGLQSAIFICFDQWNLQGIYANMAPKNINSTSEVEKIWKPHWKGEMFFLHGTEHSKGVLILIKNSLELELKTTKEDQNGRFIILEANAPGPSLSLC